MQNEDKKLETRAEVSGLVNNLVMPVVYEVCAIRYKDNSTGDGDVYFTLAYMGDDGIWLDEHSGNELLTHSGDEIIEWWPLIVGTGNKITNKA